MCIWGSQVAKKKKGSYDSISFYADNDKVLEVVRAIVLDIFFRASELPVTLTICYCASIKECGAIRVKLEE